MRVAAGLPAVTPADTGRTHDSGPVDPGGFELLLAHESARHDESRADRAAKADDPRRDDALAGARRRERDADHRPERAVEAADVQRARWTVSAQRVSSLERLDERGQAEHEIEVRRDEDRVVDDLVTGRFGRKP